MSRTTYAARRTAYYANANRQHDVIGFVYGHFKRYGCHHHREQLDDFVHAFSSCKGNMIESKVRLVRNSAYAGVIAHFEEKLLKAPLSKEVESMLCELRNEMKGEQ